MELNNLNFIKGKEKEEIVKMALIEEDEGSIVTIIKYFNVNFMAC